MLHTETKPGLVTVHGIDGSGKTTTAEGLASYFSQAGLSVVNYDTFEVGLESPYRQIKKEIKLRPIDEQLVFFLASTLFHSKHIEELISQGQWVIKSRYLLDVLAHHSHLGCRNVEEIAWKMSFLQPTLQIILVIDEVERQRRINSRDVIDENDVIPKKLGTRASYFEQYLFKYARLIHPAATTKVIDTSKQDRDSVVIQIVQALLEKAS